MVYLDSCGEGSKKIKEPELSNKLYLEFSERPQGEAFIGLIYEEKCDNDEVRIGLDKLMEDNNRCDRVFPVIFLVIVILIVIVVALIFRKPPEYFSQNSTLAGNSTML